MQRNFGLPIIGAREKASRTSGLQKCAGEETRPSEGLYNLRTRAPYNDLPPSPSRIRAAYFASWKSVWDHKAARGPIIKATALPSPAHHSNATTTTTGRTNFGCCCCCCLISRGLIKTEFGPFFLLSLPRASFIASLLLVFARVRASSAEFFCGWTARRVVLLAVLYTRRCNNEAWRHSLCI